MLTPQETNELFDFLQALFDSWQIRIFVLNNLKIDIQNSLDPCPGDEHGWENCTHHLNLCSSSQLENIKNFGVEFVKSLPQLDNASSRGLFINSCYRHGRNLVFTPRWNGVPTLANKTIAEAIGEWYFERSPFQVIDTIPDVPKNCPVCPQAPAMRLTALNI
ncbi:Pectin acetylesterase 8 [Abeliophyllum distichum]|uniref:Pectin acetylesterase n=1 Tax=Abeliophyllum distichum TaxID=126358 RepID=A0ABD1NW50_9LAMI